MSIKSRLFQFSLGFTTSVVAYMVLFDDIQTARYKNLHALEALEKDLKGEVKIRPEVAKEESLVDAIKESYKTRWLNSITSLLK